MYYITEVYKLYNLWVKIEETNEKNHEFTNRHLEASGEYYCQQC